MRDSRRFIRLVDLYTGEYWAVAGGVSLMMGYGLSGAGVARSWGEKFALIVGVKELDALGPLPFSIAAGCVQLGSVALIANGVSFSKGVINVMTLLKIALVIFLIAVGFAVARTNPFSSSGDFFAEGASGVVGTGSRSALSSRASVLREGRGLPTHVFLAGVF